MFRIFRKKWLRQGRRGARPVGKKLWQGRFLPDFEALPDRILPAITATFSAQTGVLKVFGDALHNNITVSRNAAGRIFVNNGAVAILGGTDFLTVDREERFKRLPRLEVVLDDKDTGLPPGRSCASGGLLSHAPEDVSGSSAATAVPAGH